MEVSTTMPLSSITLLLSMPSGCLGSARGKIQYTIKTIGFEQINEYLDLCRNNEIVGRAVVKF
jgi:hypothetical protein